MANTIWDTTSKSTYGILSDGNLTFQAESGHGNFVKASNGIPTGKSYCEFKIITDGTIEIGIVASNYIFSDPRYMDYGINCRAVRCWNGYKTNNTIQTAYMDSLTTNDVLGIAIDQPNNAISFYKNGVSYGVAYSDLNSLTSPLYPAISFDSAGRVTANFGATAFAYTIPTGYKAYDAPPPKFLIKQNSNYYTVNSSNYDSTTTHNFIALTLAGGSMPNESDIKTFGFDDLNVLTNSMSVGSDTFKPIDKFDNTAELKMYKPN